MLADADRAGARALLCLGDMVGYGADPVACAEAVGERAVAVVAGNHEHAALGLMSLRWFNPVAREAALWTRQRLSDGLRGYLSALPLTATLEDATLVHASPGAPRWEYLMSPDDGFEVFAISDAAVLRRPFPPARRLVPGVERTRARRVVPAWPVEVRLGWAGATSSTSAASGNRATATRAPPTRCGTSRSAS